MSSIRQRFFGGRTRVLALLSVLALAALLRGWRIRQPFTDAFSWREASTAMIAENFFRTSPNILLPEVNWSGPGPNYQGREFQTVTYLASLAYRILGQHDWIGRAIAATFGVWGVFALYQLVRHVWGDGGALAAAATMAVWPGSVFVDRSFLPDPAMVALATTTVWLFVAWLDSNRTRDLLLSGVVGGWAFATKIPGLIVGLPMAYALVSSLGVRKSLQRTRLAKLVVVISLMIVPVLAWYLWARHVALSYPPYHFAGEGNWLWNAGVREWVRAEYFLPKLWHHLTTWMWTPLPMALSLIGLLAGFLPNAVERGRLHFLFHWWLVAGVVYYAIGARELADNPWNLHIIDPAMAALAAYGMLTIARLVMRWFARFDVRDVPHLQWGVVALLLVAATVTSRRRLLVMYHDYAIRGYRMGRALDSLTTRSDLVLSMATALGDPSPIYYARRRGWIFPPAREGRSWSELSTSDAENIELLDSLRAEGARWMGVTAEQRDSLRARPVFLDHLRNSSDTIVETSDFTIYRLHSLPEAAR